MLKTIRHLLAPPVFEQDEQNRVASLLTRLLQIMFVTVTLLLMVNEIIDSTPGFTYPVLIISTASLSITYALVRQGQLRLAGALTLVFLWGISTFVSASFQGILGYFPVGYILSVILAGALLDRKGILVMTGISVLSILGLFLAETTGLIRPFFGPASQFANFIDWAFLLSLLSVFVLTNEEHLRTALATARRNEQAQLVSNRELTAIRASLEERVAERTAQLNASVEIARAASSILDPDELLQRVTLLIVERFNLYYAAAFLVDDDAKFAVLREATGDAGRVLKERGHRLEITGSSLVGLAIATRRPRRAPDDGKETMRPFGANPLLTETRSEVAVPLTVGGRVIGALDAQSTYPDTFDASLIAVLQGVADQIAIAVDNARQYQTAQVDAQQAMLLFETSQATSFIGESPISAVNRLFGIVATRADFDAWTATRFDADSRVYTVLTAFDANEPAPLEEIDQAVRIDQEYDTPTSLAIRTGQPVIINDPATDPRVAHMSPAMARSIGKLICVPALAGDRILGTISLGRIIDKPDIGSRDIQLARALANQLAVTTENRRLFAESQAAIAELNQLMALYTRQGWSQFSQLRQSAGLQQEYSQPTAKPLDPKFLPQIEQVIRARQTQPIACDGQAVVGVPIMLRGEVLGTLSVQDNQDRRWTEDDLVTVQAVADQIAQSIEAARLLENSEASLQETTTLYEVSRALSAAPSQTEAISLLVKTIYHRLHADQAALVLFDEERGYGTLVAEAVPSPDGPTLRLPMQGNPSYEILNETKRSISINDIDHHPATAKIIDLLHARRVKSMLIVPLLVGPKVIGSFGMDSESQRNFSEQEIAFCETLARQAAGTIDRYQLFEQTQTSLEETTALYQASRDIMAAQTPAAVLRGITANIGTPQIDRAVLALIDPASPSEAPVAEIVAVWERYNNQPPGLGDRWDMAKVPIIGQQISEPRAIDDIAASPDLDLLSRHVFLEVLKVKAVAIIPMYVGGRQSGWLLIESQHGPYHFTDQDLRRFRTLAGQATIALENRRLLQETQQRAQREYLTREIGAAVSKSLDLNAILRTTARELSQALGATHAIIQIGSFETDG